MALAQTLHATVAETQLRVSSREFTDWLALARIEPWGPIRDDYRAAQIVAAMASIAGRRARAPREFMPFLDIGPADTLEGMIKQVSILAAAGVLTKVG